MGDAKLKKVFRNITFAENTILKNQPRSEHTRKGKNSEKFFFKQTNKQKKTWKNILKIQIFFLFSDLNLRTH